MNGHNIYIVLHLYAWLLYKLYNNQAYYIIVITVSYKTI